MTKHDLNRREWLQRSTAAVLGGAYALQAQGAAQLRPNILLLMADQMRGDCLGAAGHPSVLTPALDRLVAEGVLFRRAYSSVPSCTPARAALLTGLGPWKNGMLGYSRIPEHYDREKPRMLREGGYSTCSIGKCHYHPQRNGHGYEKLLLDESGRVESPDFKSDYRRWFRMTAPDLNPDVTGLGWNDYPACPYALPEELHPTCWTGNEAVHYLENYREEAPFFLKVSFARPHSPYDPPQRFFDLYADREIPAPVIGDWCARYAPRASEKDSLWHGDLGADTVRHSRRGYYGSITFIDEQIARILSALEKSGRMENTLILFTADHGDMLGDHHLWRKTYGYEGSAHIPMILRAPASFSASCKGVVRDEVVELRDILPTFLDAAGLGGAEGMDGCSLLHLLRDDGSTWRPWLDLEHSRCYENSEQWNGLTDGKSKYLFFGQSGEEQLFDLKADPGECVNLAGTPGAASLLEVWRSRLTDHLQERGIDWVRDGKLKRRPKDVLHSPNYRQPEV